MERSTPSFGFIQVRVIMEELFSKHAPDRPKVRRKQEANIEHVTNPMVLLTIDTRIFASQFLTLSFQLNI